MKKIINKLKDIIRTWLNIDLISNKAIYDINKTIGVDKNSYLNNLSELLQKDNELEKEIEVLKRKCEINYNKTIFVEKNFNEFKNCIYKDYDFQTHKLISVEQYNKFVELLEERGK